MKKRNNNLNRKFVAKSLVGCVSSKQEYLLGGAIQKYGRKTSFGPQLLGYFLKSESTFIEMLRDHVKQT